LYAAVVVCRGAGVLCVEQNHAGDPARRIRNDRLLALPLASRRGSSLASIAGCTSGIGRDVAALHRAETWLGDDHNVVVLCEELSKDPSICGGPVNLDRLRLVAHQYQCELRRKALAGTRRIYRRKSRQYQRTVKLAWKAFQRHGRPRRSPQTRRAAA
jgi:hypothetical protein